LTKAIDFAENILDILADDQISLEDKKAEIGQFAKVSPISSTLYPQI